MNRPSLIMKTKPTNIDRRNALKTMTLTAAGMALARPGGAADENPKKRLRIGLIGCGGRGTMMCRLMVKHGGYEIVAGADYFQDKVDAFGKKFSVPKERLFTGLNCYKKLIEDGQVDAVAIESPPYFHPEQARAAVEAGKHVYLAKPIAVDVAGSLSVEETAALATKKGLCFLVDFQTRADKHFQEAIRRVHSGAIGKFSFGESSYHAGDPFKRNCKYLEADAKNPENQLRAWGVDRVLSGDIITEQNIHTIDVAGWIMNQPPLTAVGSCNRKMRPHGNCKDHFSVIYKYADDVDISFTSRQFDGQGTKPDGIRNRMFGSKGVLETQYAGMVLLRAKEFYKGADTGLYQSGPFANLTEFHKNVLAGDASNTTVAPSVQSNLLTILGRTAAYTGKPVVWETVLASKEKWKLELELKA